MEDGEQQKLEQVKIGVDSMNKLENDENNKQDQQGQEKEEQHK